MGAEENLAAAKRGYAAFGAGDAATAMAEMVDDIEWVTPGNSAVSGTVRGKQALGEHWAKFGAKGYGVTPEYWFADGDRVVVLGRRRLDVQRRRQARQVSERGGYRAPRTSLRHEVGVRSLG